MDFKAGRDRWDRQNRARFPFGGPSGPALPRCALMLLIVALWATPLRAHDKYTSFAEAREVFKEQVEALVAAGVDLLIFETFYQIQELREALFAAHEVVGDSMAVIAQVTINDDGHMLDGTSTETFAAYLNEWPCDVIGLNCSVGPKATLETLEKIMPFTKKPL